MDKWQAIHNFWSGFNVPAYDQSSVPDDAGFPRITYAAAVSNFENPVPLTASVWDYSSSWAGISNKVDEIAVALTPYKIIKVDGGYLCLIKGQPFAQRYTDTNSMVRRVYIVLQAEFFTNV